MNVGKAIARGLRSAKLFTQGHSPEILMAVGTGGFVATVVMAVQATPKAIRKLDRAEEESYRYHGIRRKVFVVAKVAPSYIPAVVMGAASLGCFFKAHSVHVERQMALAGLYSMASQTLNQYQDKLIERFGEDVHEKVLERVLEDHEPPEEVQQEALTMTTSSTDDNVLFYDRTTGRYFRCTQALVREAESQVVKQTADEGFCTLNYFYEYLGVEDNTFIGEAIGWDQERCRLDIVMRPWKDDTGTELCWMIVYNTTVIEPNALRSR